MFCSESKLVKKTFNPLAFLELFPPPPLPIHVAELPYEYSEIPPPHPNRAGGII